jgi:hypothetical protein
MKIPPVDTESFYADRGEADMTKFFENFQT